MSEKRRGWRGEKGRKRERKDRRARGRGAEAPGPCALLSPGRRSRSHLVGAHAQKRHDLKCRDLKRRDLKRRDLRCSLDPLFWVQAVAGRAPDRLHRLRGKPPTPSPPFAPSLEAPQPLRLAFWHRRSLLPEQCAVASFPTPPLPPPPHPPQPPNISGHLSRQVGPAVTRIRLQVGPFYRAVAALQPQLAFVLEGLARNRVLWERYPGCPDDDALPDSPAPDASAASAPLGPSDLEPVGASAASRAAEKGAGAS